MPTHLRDSISGRSLAVDATSGAELTVRLSLPGRPQALPLHYLRPLLYCDVLVRWLRTQGLRVRHLRSLPDVPADAAASAFETLQRDAELFGLIEAERDTGTGQPPESFVAQVELSSPASGAPARCQLRLTSWELEPERGTAAGGPSARELVAGLEAEAVRYHALSVHYRAPLSLTRAALQEAERRVEYLYRTRERLAAVEPARLTESTEVAEEISSFVQRLAEALDDDLNTPLALTALSELLKHINDLAERAKGKKNPVGHLAVRSAREALDRCARVLGLGDALAAPLLAGIRSRRAAQMGLDEVDLQRLIAERVSARAHRDFQRTDAIRQQISELGVELIDGPEGTHWRIP